ncbi:MAG: hypothetical protein AMXMBFR33_61530 [Candidatus Xenobia bacterium]
MLGTAALGAAVSLPALAEVPLRIQCSDLSQAEQRKVVADLKALTGGPRQPPAERLESGRRWLAGLETPAGEWLELPDGPRVRVLQARSPRGALLQLHGGGWCLGAATSGEEQLARLSLATGLTVVSVDYRLAPEHPFPAGPEDCLKAARWLLESELGAGKLYLRGSSAGAHLAVSTLVGLGAKAARFAGAVLYYGVYDLAGTPSRLLAADEDHPDLAPTSMEEYTRWFLPTGTDRRRGDVSPLYARLEDLPPALMLVGTQDILLDDSLFLAARWGAAGSEVDLVIYPNAPHGFDGYPTEMARDAQAREVAFLKA